MPDDEDDYMSTDYETHTIPITFNRNYTSMKQIEITLEGLNISLKNTSDEDDDAPTTKLSLLIKIQELEQNLNYFKVN